MLNQTRREFLKTTALAASSLILPRSVFARQTQTDRPNILLIISDEHNAGVLGCYGNEIIRTPNLDKLGASGITFDACYCNSPLCVPSRLAFTAGKYISHILAWNNNCWLPTADYPSLPRILNAVGYESFLCGKMHYDKTRRYGFTEISGNMNTSTMTGRGSRRRPDDLTPIPGVSDRFNQFRPGDDSPVLRHDCNVTAAASEFLKNRRASDKPFFLLAGYLAPHFPLIVPQKYWDNYRGKVPMPVIPPGHLKSQVRNYQHHRIAFNTEDAPKDVVRKGRELYYGLTEWVDEEIGKVLQTLADSEFADNTVVIYTTDHGENMGEHGLWWKNCMYDHAARIPLIVSCPARWNGPQRRAGACSLVDVAATITELAGAKAPSDWDGDSMLQWLDNGKAKWKDLAVSEYYGHNIASGFAMIRMADFKYVYHTPADQNHPAERELYDLRADPGEFNNLADDPESKPRIEQMYAALVAELGADPDKTELRCRADYARGYQRPDVQKNKRKGAA